MALTNVFQADNIKNTTPHVFFSLWATPMILLTAGKLTDPQQGELQMCARLGGISRVASTGWHRPGAPPQTKILAMPARRGTTADIGDNLLPSLTVCGCSLTAVEIETGPIFVVVPFFFCLPIFPGTVPCTIFLQRPLDLINLSRG